MNAAAKLLGPALMLVVAAGCGTVHLDAPEGRRVKVLERDAPTSVHVEETVWYFAWGGVDLSDTHTAAIIEKHDLAEVKVHVTYDFSDSLINTFATLLSFNRRRIIIDGNPAKKDGP
jgi:hypothetical protein